MTLHVRVSFAIYQLYKVTSQVSLVTALIEEDHFLYLSSFMDKYFSGNAFKFLIFFNLLTFNIRVLNLAGSLARSESHLLLCCDWLFAADVTHSCARAPLTQDQAWVDRESWWSASWYQESQIGVVWFCQLKTYPITLNLFIYHHGTGPGSSRLNGTAPTSRHWKQ